VPKPDPLEGILGNHAEYPDPVSKMSALALKHFNADDMEGYRAALDCIRIITCARTRAEAMEIADRSGVPWSIRTKLTRKKAKR
jgi:hypothetical protein